MINGDDVSSEELNELIEEAEKINHSETLALRYLIIENLTSRETDNGVTYQYFHYEF